MSYRVLSGGAFVLFPDGEEREVAVDLVQSPPGAHGLRAGGVGVRLLDGPLAGAVILVSEAWISKLRHEGKPVEEIA